MLVTTRASVSPSHAVCYPKGNLRQGDSYSASAGPSSRAVSPGTAWWVPEGATFTRAARCSIHLLEYTSSKLLPFATTNAFGDRSPARTKPRVIAVFSSTRLPGFSGRKFLTTTGSSATSHRVGFFLSCLLKSPTDPIDIECRLPDDARLPQLLCWLPVDHHILKHVLPLSTYRALRLFARLPRQSAESGSLPLWTINLL